MPYVSNTDAERAEMFSAIGVDNMNELWKAAGVTTPPPELDRFPAGKSEFEVTRFITDLSNRNRYGLVSFLGMGYYDHMIPAAVDAIVSQYDFATAYTPYQAEASQGTLQAIFEYQSMICRLTGMDVSNASMYDGGTALFEAVMMAVRVTGRRRAVVSGAGPAIFRRMLRGYCRNLDVELVEVDPSLCGSRPEALLEAAGDSSACVVVQYPNVFGTLENWSDFNAVLAGRKVLSICSAYPTALALARTPGEMGFDIVTGEGQCLGIPLSFGGPYLGFMAVREKLMRKMPGRLVGRAKDASGRDGFVLTIQSREQHIRRQKATSNICSNENLCALRALVYLSCIGKQGFVDVARRAADNAVRLREALLAIPGVEPVTLGSFFNEFVVKLPVDASEVIGRLIDRGFAAGFPLGRYYDGRDNQLLVAVTEKRTVGEIKRFAAEMEEVLK
ncbi:MAG: aminomethyl-transferring glycine dehydrogenase subunit GcvPA [Victivallaceae bacterium]|nr:aminomethyl-transferring glycine dehydrogenase subunit GcvPA [Victivallaceae bacterium]